MISASPDHDFHAKTIAIFSQPFFPEIKAFSHTDDIANTCMNLQIAGTILKGGPEYPKISQYVEIISDLYLIRIPSRWQTLIKKRSTS